MNSDVFVPVEQHKKNKDKDQVIAQLQKEVAEGAKKINVLELQLAEIIQRMSIRGIKMVDK